MIYRYNVNEHGKVTTSRSRFSNLKRSTDYWNIARSFYKDNPTFLIKPEIARMYYEDTDTNEFIQVFPVVAQVSEATQIFIKLSATRTDQ